MFKKQLGNFGKYLCNTVISLLRKEVLKKEFFHFVCLFVSIDLCISV